MERFRQNTIEAIKASIFFYRSHKKWRVPSGEAFNAFWRGVLVAKGFPSRCVDTEGEQYDDAVTLTTIAECGFGKLAGQSTKEERELMRDAIEVFDRYSAQMDDAGGYIEPFRVIGYCCARDGETLYWYALNPKYIDEIVEYCESNPLVAL